MSDKKKVSILLVDDFVELKQHVENWNMLLESSPGSGPGQSFSWVQAYFKYVLKKNQKWICLFAYHDKKLVGVYPLICNSKKKIITCNYQPFQTPYNTSNTTRVDGLILEGYEFVLHLFLNEIRRTFKVFPVIHLRGLPVFSPTLSVAAKMKDHRVAFLIRASSAENYLKTDHGEYDDYIKKLSSSFKKKMKRYLILLKNQYSVRFVFKEDSRSNQENFREFINLENSGWKGEKGTSIKRNPGDFNLFRSVTENFDLKSQVFFNFLIADDCAIAGQMCFKINNVLFIWKTAYREDYSAFSPGNLLRFEFIKYCFENDGIREINFVSENVRFKRLNANTRKLFEVKIFPKVIFISLALKIYYWIRLKIK